MSYIHPAAVEHQRQRSMRPDWQRWMRPDPHLLAPAGFSQAKSYAERLIETRQVEKEEARLAAEREVLGADLLALRRELAEIKFALALRRIAYKYRDDQPRVPKGNPDGGQWTGDAGRDANLISKPAAMRTTGQGQSTEFSAARKPGHHYLPQGVYNKRRLSDETRQVFEDATTGKLDDKRLNVFNRPHRNYNEAVNELFDQFLAKKGISEEQMTPDHARQLLGEVITSTDPRIQRFNQRIWMRQIFRGFRGGFRGNE
jgi:hypothetical protein